MATDPGFSSDTCIFMEAVSGDGGMHDSTATWWLSPDISLKGPNSGVDTADPGLVNKISILFRRKGATSGCSFPGAESITVEAWVANPSLAMVPSNSNSCRRVGFIGSPLPFPGATGIQPIDWTPRIGLPASDPESGGQKCLIARAYPDNLSPSSIQFFVPDDQHVVQHNLFVVTCPASSSVCSFKVFTVNPLARANVLKIKLRAQFDANPTEFVRKTVLHRVQSIPGFHQLATQPPASLGFDLSGLPALGLIPQQIGPTTTTSTVSDTQLNLAGQLISFTFFAKLSHASGLAHIFHLTQRGPDDKAQGGLTVVMIRV